MAHDWHPRAHAAGLRHLRLVETEASEASIARQLLAALVQLATATTLGMTQHETLEAAIQQARAGAAPTGE
jgi:hypothetical protein